MFSLLRYDTEIVDACTALKNRWMEWNTADPCPFTTGDLAPLTSAQIVLFLTLILEDSTELSLKKVKAMQEVYNFNVVKNSEIRFG